MVSFLLQERIAIVYQLHYCVSMSPTVLHPLTPSLVLTVAGMVSVLQMTKRRVLRG